MGIAITCNECGVRFREGQTIAKVDRSEPFKPDVAYYCLKHVPKGVECITAKVEKFQRDLKPRNPNEVNNIRKVCKECGEVFMAHNSRRKFCSQSCSSAYFGKRRVR